MSVAIVMVMGVHIVLMHEPMLVSFGHGPGFEVQGEMAHPESFR